MQREAPRSVQSLMTPYQRKIQSQDYEVIVVDNGSSERLNEKELLALGGNVKYFFLENAPSSPAYAINFGVEKSSGEVLCIMVDGAHILTPGVLSYGLDLFRSLDNPVVLTPQFFLGPGAQMDTILTGYSETEEDALLDNIEWPLDGYRLFEIGEPYRIEPKGKRPKLFWLVRMFESNCLFVRKDSYHRVGRCDERFDMPGGGILLPDLFKELSRLENVEIVQLIGEASFHQIHGGTSTNISKEQQKLKWESYLDQYKEIRGEPYKVTSKPIRFYGHMPNVYARNLMLTG